MQFFYCTFHWYPNVQRQISNDAMSANACWCNKEVIVLYDFLGTVKAVSLIFISGHGSAISSPKQGKSGSIYNLVKN